MALISEQMEDIILADSFAQGGSLRLEVEHIGDEALTSLNLSLFEHTVELGPGPAYEGEAHTGFFVPPGLTYDGDGETRRGVGWDYRRLRSQGSGALADGAADWPTTEMEEPGASTRRAIPLSLNH